MTVDEVLADLEEERVRASNLDYERNRAESERDAALERVTELERQLDGANNRVRTAEVLLAAERNRHRDHLSIPVYSGVPVSDYELGPGKYLPKTWQVGPDAITEFDGRR